MNYKNKNFIKNLDKLVFFLPNNQFNFNKYNKNYNGFNLYLKYKTICRLEFAFNQNFSNLNKEYSCILNKFCLDSFYIIFNLKKKILLNLFFNFLIVNYKSNRHILNLPLNGQRT